MSILDHVVYANQQKKATPKHRVTKQVAIIGHGSVTPILVTNKPVPAIPAKGEHDRFKKLPGERDQLKALKKQLKPSTTQKTYNAFTALTT